MVLIKQGAEAALYREEWLGEQVLIKQRVAKPYRIPALDQQIRRERTKQEAILLHRAKVVGVRVPFIRWIDRNKHAIGMEWIEGKPLKEVLSAQSQKYCLEAGKIIGKLHGAGIVHGDLTTSNILLHSQELVLIDFGLGFFSDKTEDRAVDLLNLKKTLQATHAQVTGAFEAVWKGYRVSYADSSAVEKQLRQIELRIRYT